MSLEGYLGDFPDNAVFAWPVPFFASGVLMAPVGLALAAYKDANATQTTTGVSIVTTSFDGMAGMVLVSVDTTDAFYTPGSEFHMVATAGTLEGVSLVGRVLFDFSLERATANVVKWRGTQPNILQGGRIDAHMGSVAAAVLTAAAFAAGAFDAVWAVAARLLTAGTNIVLAKGTGITGFNDLSAAQVNLEADAALADAGLSAATLVGPLVTVVADGGNTALTFKIDLTALPTNGPMDAWLSFELTTTTVALRGQVKRVASFNTTTDFLTLASAYTTIPAAGDIARLVTR